MAAWHRPILIALAVAGAVALAAPGSAEVSVRSDGQYRYVQSDGLPNHATGAFPNADNPNALSAQSHSFRMPANPQQAGRMAELGMNLFGVAVNGVPFDPFAAEWWNRDRNSGWQYEPLGGGIDLGVDAANAHVQPDGSYHYHGIPGPLAGAAADGHSVLIGWAADGFPIYVRHGYADPTNPAGGAKALRSSYRVRQGARSGGPGGAYDGTFVQDYEYVAGLGDLDACNGRFAVTPDYPGGSYAYFLTDAYPHIPRCFAGTPDPSFARGGPGGAGGQGGPGGQGGGPGGPPAGAGGPPPGGPPPGGPPPPRPPRQ